MIQLILDIIHFCVNLLCVDSIVEQRLTFLYRSAHSLSDRKGQTVSFSKEIEIKNEFKKGEKKLFSKR